MTLDEVIKATNRRVNAIEHVIIPRYERTVFFLYFFHQTKKSIFKVAYIISELDEAEREEFYRLKKVQAKKKELKELEEEFLRKLKLEGFVRKFFEMFFKFCQKYSKNPKWLRNCLRVKIDLQNLKRDLQILTFDP